MPILKVAALMSFIRKRGMVLGLIAFLQLVGVSQAQARHEVLTVPWILADYYAFSYSQAFLDRAHPYAWSTAGVDALGWGVVVFAKKYPGLVLVNVAGIAKTVYPIVRLANGGTPMEIRRRAWASVGTHAATLVMLKFLSKPAVSVHSYAPPSGGSGVELAFRF